MLPPLSQYSSRFGRGLARGGIELFVDDAAFFEAVLGTSVYVGKVNIERILPPIRASYLTIGFDLVQGDPWPRLGEWKPSFVD